MSIVNDFVFQQFFLDCIGNWQSERTYHYLSHQEIERSRTTFEVIPLTLECKNRVLEDNQYEKLDNLASFPGFSLGFYTISEKGEEVRQNLNLMFVPTKIDGAIIEGDYLRDRSYEEARPIVSHFSFNCVDRELLMTTNYTRVVSVDSITMSNPNLRIRKIINYQRPLEAKPLEKVLLVGFGVEQKVINS
jgi:hypothetical protein